MRQYMLVRTAGTEMRVQWATKKKATRWAKKGLMSNWVDGCDDLPVLQAQRLMDTAAVPWGMVRADGTESPAYVPRRLTADQVKSLEAMGMRFRIVTAADAS